MPDISVMSAGRVGDDLYYGVITNTVINALNGFFVGDQLRVTLKPTHIALGNGTAPATVYDTELQSETHRFGITQLTQSDGITTALVNLPITSEALEASEMGVFAGDTMLCRANVSVLKNSNNILNIIWMLQIKEG